MMLVLPSEFTEVPNVFACVSVCVVWLIVCLALTRTDVNTRSEQVLWVNLHFHHIACYCVVSSGWNIFLGNNLHCLHLRQRSVSVSLLKAKDNVTLYIIFLTPSACVCHVGVMQSNRCLVWCYWNGKKIVFCTFNGIWPETRLQIEWINPKMCSYQTL